MGNYPECSDLEHNAHTWAHSLVEACDLTCIEGWHMYHASWSHIWPHDQDHVDIGRRDRHCKFLAGLVSKCSVVII